MIELSALKRVEEQFYDKEILYFYEYTFYRKLKWNCIGWWFAVEGGRMHL